MKEHPMIFTGESIRAIPEGRKTMTRRLIIPQPPETLLNPVMVARDSASPSGYSFISDEFGSIPIKCRYHVGERIWVREAFAVRADGVDQILYKSDYDSIVDMLELKEVLKQSGRLPFAIKWKPPIHMFRKDSRIDLEITELLAPGRLQEITYDDILLEGWDVKTSKPFTDRTAGEDAKEWFIRLWDSIYDKGMPIKDHPYRWQLNPWVRPIRFKGAVPLIRDASEVTAIWDITNGVDPVEHIRRMRDDERD